MHFKFSLWSSILTCTRTTSFHFSGSAGCGSRLACEVGICHKRKGNCEEHLTSTNCRPTVGRQITNSLLTGHRQVTNRLPTVGKNTREKKYSTETYVKTNKTYQKRRTKSEKLTKSEEQLIVNPEVWINMEKKPSSEDQAFEKDVWIKM